MNLNFKIKDLNIEEISRIKFKCVNCSFWLDNKTSLFDDITSTPTIAGFFKEKLIELRNIKGRKYFIPFLLKNGGRVKAAFSGKKCIGLLLAGNYYLFPKLKVFDIYPPDINSIFLGCVYISPDYRNIGVGKKLLIELEKDLIDEKIRAIESVGKRMDDDLDIEEYISEPIIPVKFLIKNGFHIKKNDIKYPLLRMDLSTISLAKNFIKRRLTVKNAALERAVKEPVIFKKD